MHFHRLPADLLPNGASPPGRRAGAAHRGHDHFWHRALSRRHLVRTAAGVTAVAIGAGLRAPRLTRAAQMDGAMPKPVPGGLELPGFPLIHVYDYSQGQEPSTITDFRGLVGINHLQTEGTVTTGGGGGGLSTPTATGDRLVVDVDMRFMQGTFIAEDGQEHQGTFGFV